MKKKRRKNRGRNSSRDRQLVNYPQSIEVEQSVRVNVRRVKATQSAVQKINELLG